MIKYDPEKNPYSNKIEHGWVENDKYLAWRAGYEQALRDVEKQNKEDGIDRMKRELEDYRRGINEARDRIAKQHDR